MYNNMKLEAKYLTARSRILRQERESFKRKARRAASLGENYPRWQERMVERDTERKVLGEFSRYLGIARAFVKERHYRSVENQVREGNEVDTDLLVQMLNSWGYEPARHNVRNWLCAA